MLKGYASYLQHSVREGGRGLSQEPINGGEREAPPAEWIRLMVLRSAGGQERAQAGEGEAEGWRKPRARAGGAGNPTPKRGRKVATGVQAVARRIQPQPAWGRGDPARLPLAQRARGDQRESLLRIRRGSRREVTFLAPGLQTEAGRHLRMKQRLTQPPLPPQAARPPTSSGESSSALAADCAKGI